MSRREKSTGWKTPLMFCAAIGLLVAIGAYIIEETVELPLIPEELEKQAKAIDINLERDGAAAWKQRIVEAGSGFTSHDSKDGKLAAITEEALDTDRFDAACTAIVLVHNVQKRNALLRAMYNRASAQCETLPWAVFAIHGIKNGELATELAKNLESRWQDCRHSTQ